MSKTAMRTHRCGALRAIHIGEQVQLAGWVHRRRDLGGLVFYDLRDRDGLVQVAFGPDWASEKTIRDAGLVGAETVVAIDGVVIARPADAVNPEMDTGEVEVQATSCRILGPATPPAIPVWRSKGEDLAAEERRLEHRFLDLRRAEMQHNLELRHRLLQQARRTLSDMGFLEIETPILTRPTPEGARDFLVPSRVQRGHFYALPQSPQIYKQVLMCSGFDRYFQISRCFRDEDLRADRQPEFTQIDLEASFVDQEDIFEVIELLLTALWAESGEEVGLPFPRMRHAEAMERFGSDKPDLRFALEIEDIAERVVGLGFAAFDETLKAGGRVRALRVPGGARLSRRETDALTALAKDAGLLGLALLKRKGDELSGPLAKLESMSAERMGLDDGDLLLAAAGSNAVTSRALGKVRLAVIDVLGISPTVRHAFHWVHDFPLFEPDETTGELTFAHHPFTSPHPDDIALLEQGQREGVRACHYDVVYNGNELGSGSLRIADPKLQLLVLQHLGINAEDAERRFGFLLSSLRGGAPPHGGMALGFDRIAMFLAGAQSLRDVIAFPKTTAARALFEDAPIVVDNADLRDLGISVTV